MIIRNMVIMIYSNGEDYELIVSLQYNKETAGKINYRFNFLSVDNITPSSRVC